MPPNIWAIPLVIPICFLRSLLQLCNRLHYLNWCLYSQQTSLPNWCLVMHLSFAVQMQVLLHEGGTLLVCLNSIRALNNPTWSWLQDLWQLVDGLRKAVADLLNKRPPRNHVIQAAPL